MSSLGMSSPGMTTEVILTATPGQTVGPFYGYALPYPGSDQLVPPGRADAIRLHGTVYDGAGSPVPTRGRTTTTPGGRRTCTSPCSGRSSRSG